MTKETEQDEDDDKKPFFYHLKYHRRGIQRQQVQEAYKNYLSPHLPQKLTVCIHRPRNLQDELCRTKLKNIPGQNPSDVLKSTKEDKNPK